MARERRRVAALLSLAAALPLAAVAQTNVPDAITRRSGLRVTPMPHAAQTYATNCQGCHGDLGASALEIPVLAGRVGYFTRSDAGRRYLVQVPNVALNPSSDADIAEVLNWLLMTYSRPQLVAGFRPYTAAEVRALRTARIDVGSTRQRVVDELVATRAVASADVLAIPAVPLY